MSSTLINILIHVVFSSKGREPTISKENHERLYVYIGGIIRSEGAEPLRIGGVEDHVHFAMKIKSSPALSDLVRKTKNIHICGTMRASAAPSELGVRGVIEYPGFAPRAVIPASFGGKTGVERIS